MSKPLLVVRCFAREDQGLVNEWPVTLPLEEVRAIVPGGDLSDIHPIDEAAAVRLLGPALAPSSEPVDYFLEPAEYAPETPLA